MGMMDKAKDLLGNEKVDQGIDKAQEKFVDNDAANKGIDKAQETFGPASDNK